jgi:hypothetical protein
MLAPGGVEQGVDGAADFCGRKLREVFDETRFYTASVARVRTQ